MAQNCSDSQIAHRLRVIAADYFAAAHVGNKPAQQQQQVQSDKKPRSDEDLMGLVELAGKRSVQEGDAPAFTGVVRLTEAVNFPAGRPRPAIGAYRRR